MTERDDKGRFAESNGELEEYRELFEDFSSRINRQKENTNTIERHKKGVRYWLLWCEDNDIDPREVRRRDVVRYLDSILGYSPAEIGSRYSAVNVFYSWFCEIVDPDLDHPSAEIDITEEPFSVNTDSVRYVDELKRDGNRENVKILSKAEVEELFNREHIPEPKIRNELIIRLLWQTAVRSDELSRMKKNNLDWDLRDIRIRSSKLDADDDLYHRHVFWDPSLDNLLQEWLFRRREALSPYASESDYLFLSHQSEQLNSSYISRIVKETAKNAGIQEVMYHDAKGDPRYLVTAHRLRHSRISYLANHTSMGIDSLRRMAGHKKLSTTQGYISKSWEDVRNDYHTAIRRADWDE